MNQDLFRSLLQSVLQSQLDFLKLKHQNINLSEIDFKSFRKDFEMIHAGFYSRNYGNTECPKLITLITDENIQAMTVRNLVSPLGIFAFWEDKNNLDSLWKKIGNSVRSLINYSEIRKIAPNNKEEMLFYLSNSRIFKLEGWTSAIYLAFESKLYDQISLSIATQDENQKFLNWMQEEFKKTDGLRKGFQNFQIEKQKEFLLGEYFLPRTFLWGNIPAKTKVKRVKETHITDADASTFWFGLSLTYDKSYYLQYGFPHQKLEHPEAVLSKYQSLFVTITKSVISSRWNQLSHKLEKSGSKYLEKPLLPFFEKGVLVEYEIQLNQTSILAQVLVPKLLVDFLMKLYQKTSLSEITEPSITLFQLNDHLIQEFVSQRHRLYFHKITNRESPILLFEFLQIISEAETKLIIQNYFVANGVKTIDLQKLFFYLTINPESMETFLYFEEDFDESKTKSFLPPGMQKEWENFQVHSDNRTGLKSIAYSEIDFLEKNRIVMKELYTAAKTGKILFSSRAEYILNLEFEDLLQKEWLSQMKEIHESFSHIFSKFKNIPKANLQQFFYSYQSNDYGSIFLLWEEVIVKIQPYVSKQFYHEIADDCKAKQLQYESKMLDLTVVIELKKKFLTELSGITLEEFV